LEATLKTFVSSADASFSMRVLHQLDDRYFPGSKPKGAEMVGQLYGYFSHNPGRARRIGYAGDAGGLFRR
jgi:hypothetical protein